MHGHALDIFIQIVQEHRFWGYTILFIAMVFEGETVLIIAGMLTTIKAFDIGDTWLIAFIGVVLGNVTWYSLGWALKDVPFAQKMIKRAEGMITLVLPRFREKPFKSIFISKFIYGANRATVIMSGVLHVPFKLFFKAESTASVLWVTLYLSVGYFFGQAAVSITHKVSQLALIALVSVVGFVLIQHWASKYYERRELEKNESSHS